MSVFTLDGAAIKEFGNGTGRIQFEGVLCTGDETNLLDCPRGDIGEHDCAYHEEAGVTCFSGEDADRLDGGICWGFVRLGASQGFDRHCTSGNP